MGNFAGSLGGHFTLRQNVYEISVNTPGNSSVVRCDLWIDCDSTGTGVFNLGGTSSYSANVNGNVATGNFNYDFRGNANSILLRTFDTGVGHDGNGDATIGWSSSANMNNSPYNTTAGVSGSLGLTHINRYAAIDGFNINSVTDTAIQFAWHADNNVDYISWWSTAYDGGGHHDIPASGQGWFTIDLTSLMSERTYDITVAVRRADSGLWTNSSTQNPTTGKQNNFFGE